MSLTRDWEYENDIRARYGATNVHGICMTTSCHWAKNSLTKGKMLTEPLRVSLLAAGAMHAVRSHEQAAIDARGGSFRSRVDQWHAGYFEPMRMRTSSVVVSAAGKHSLTSSQGVYLLTIYGSGGGHTMAFARFRDRSVFFDPNFGQFSCKASIFSSFKSAVAQHLTDTYPDLQRDSFTYRVTL